MNQNILKSVLAGFLLVLVGNCISLASTDKKPKNPQFESELCAEAHYEMEIGVENNLEFTLSRMRILAPISPSDILMQVNLIIQLFDKKLTPHYQSKDSSETFKNSYRQTYSLVYLQAKSIAIAVTNLPLSGESVNNYTGTYVELSHKINRLNFSLVSYYFSDCIKQ